MTGFTVVCKGFAALCPSCQAKDDYDEIARGWRFNLEVASTSGWELHCS